MRSASKTCTFELVLFESSLLGFSIGSYAAALRPIAFTLFPISADYFVAFFLKQLAFSHLRYSLPIFRALSLNHPKDL